MSCNCQRSRVAVVHNGVRALSRGTFERADDFGRGMFERTDNFGGLLSSIGSGLGWIGSNVLAPLLPAGLQIGTALATRAVMGGSQQPAQPAGQQGPLQTAISQEQQRSDASKIDSKYLILGAIVLGGLFLYSQRRRR